MVSIVDKRMGGTVVLRKKTSRQPLDFKGGLKVVKGSLASGLR